jgi:uncharacterized protein (DUF2147 family)
MKIYFVLLLLFISSIGLAQDKFIGIWTAENENLTIEIYFQKEAYYAKIKSSENKKIKDKVVLIQMIKKSDSHLYGGMYYDDKLKSEFEAKLKIIDDDTMRLKIMTGLCGKTVVWHRD